MDYFFLKKHSGSIVAYIIVIAVFLSNLFGIEDYLRKKFFPNDRDKIEKQFFEVFDHDESDVVSPISWNHPGNSKERAAFIARLIYHGDDFNAYVLENLKLYLHDLQIQKLLPEKYDGIAFWITSYLSDSDRDEIILSFYVDIDSLYSTDWSSISNEALWNKIGIP